MKKFIEKLSMIVSISVGILLSLLMIVSIFASELTMEETKEMLDGNPYKITQWMAQNIKTSIDSSGYTQPPERMFKWRKGDCEDWAVLSRYFLEGKYETHLIIWRGKFREDSKYYAQMKGRLVDHCVVALFNGKDWGIIDQDRYIPNGSSLPDIVKINCDLRKIRVEKAFIVDFLKYRRKKIEEIDFR